MFTKEKVYAFGYIAGVIEAAAQKAGKSIVTPFLFERASAYPLEGFALIHSKAIENRLIDDDTVKRISSYSLHISVDGEDLVSNRPLSNTLRGSWQIGYYHALNGIAYQSKSGNKIKEMRLLVGLTQAELAKKMGEYQGNISRWENNEIAPSSKTLKNLAEVLNCKVSDLI